MPQGWPPGRGGPGQESLPYQEGLRHLLDRLALLPHGHRERRQTHRAAAEEPQQRLEHRAVEAVESAGVHLVHPQGGGSHLPGDQAVHLDLGIVTDAAQQPVGDTGRAARAARDLGGAVGLYLDIEQLGGAVDDPLQLGGVVELHMGGEAEAVAQRGGSRPARVVAPTRVKGGSSIGMAVAPGPFPTITSTLKSSMAM